MSKIIQANIIDLYGLIDLCWIIDIKKFYNISTSSVKLPVQTMYSSSKMFGETMIDSLNDERFVNVRPYSVYGFGEADHRFIPTVIRCLKSGETMPLCKQAVHDWIHVEDFVKAMFAGHTEIGTGTQTRNIEVVQMLEDISGRRLNYIDGGCKEYDTAKWQCRKGLEHRTLYTGLKETYERYDKKNIGHKLQA
jgi:nucleoside-diphosphate-sugar epimerase